MKRDDFAGAIIMTWCVSHGCMNSFRPTVVLAEVSNSHENVHCLF